MKLTTSGAHECKPLRVALVGNMNNNLSALLYGLRQLGHDAVLYYGTEESFQPRVEPYYPVIAAHCQVLALRWPETFSLSWYLRHRALFRALVAELNTFDVIVYCYNLHAYYALAGLHRPAIWRQYGNDFAVQCSPYHLRARTKGLPGYRKVAFALQDTLGHTLARSFFRRHLAAVFGLPRILEARNPSDDLELRRRYVHLGIFGVDYRALVAPAPRSSTEHTFRIISTARHVWCDRRPENLDYKGNEWVIEAFAKFFQQAGHPSAELWMVEKGQDIAASKALCNDLGIEDQVRWYPQLPKTELLTLVAASDLYLGQFPTDGLTNPKAAYGTAELEAMCLGVPAIGNLDQRNPSMFPGRELPPLVNVTNVEELATAIGHLHSNPEFRRETAQRQRAWFEQYHSRGNLAQVDALLRHVAAGGTAETWCGDRTMLAGS